MNSTRLSERAQQKIAEILGAGDVAVDATIGNGHDTLFLSRQVGPQGTVYGFDIQQTAIQNTQSHLRSHGVDGRIQLFLTSHEQFRQVIPERHQSRIKAFMFNLGYLPGSDKTVTTHPASSLLALKLALQLLVPEGRISILAYTGHRGGRKETESIKAFSRSLPDCFSVDIEIPYPDKSKNPPQLILIEKVTLSGE